VQVKDELDNNLQHVIGVVQYSGRAVVGDGWESNTNRPLINFMAVTPKGMRFLYTVDTSEVSDQITVTAKYDSAHLLILLRLWTKKGLQGGKTIQQRSEFFASLVPNASTSSLAHALVRSLYTGICVYYSVSTQLCVAATLLLLPGSGTHDSDLGLIVVTP